MAIKYILHAAEIITAFEHEVMGSNEALVICGGEEAEPTGKPEHLSAL